MVTKFSARLTLLSTVITKSIRTYIIYYKYVAAAAAAQLKVLAIDRSCALGSERAYKQRKVMERIDKKATEDP